MRSPWGAWCTPSPMSLCSLGTHCLREGSSHLLLSVHLLLEEGSGLKIQGIPRTPLMVPVAGACGLHTRAEDGEVHGATQPERQSRGAGCTRRARDSLGAAQLSAKKELGQNRPLVKEGA